MRKHAQHAADAQAAARIEELQRWGRAIGKSKSQSLEKASLLKLIEFGEAPPLSEKNSLSAPIRSRQRK